MACLGVVYSIEKDGTPLVYKQLSDFTAMAGDTTMAFTPDFTNFTQPLSDETGVTSWFAVSTLVAHSGYASEFGLRPRRFSEYAFLRGIYTTECPIPTPSHSLPGNSDGNVLKSSLL